MMALRGHNGPTQSKTAPLKSITGEEITDKKLQMERWVEHFSDLYSRQNTVSPSALDAIECLPTMDELDAEPTLEELNKAIDSLSTGKAPGSDEILPDLHVLKHCKTVLLLPLHELLCQCWKEAAVPQDMRDSKIVTLYKNKGKRSDCNNYRGISLLSVVGKRRPLQDPTQDRLSTKATGVEQGCVLAPTLFGIFFALLLKQAFGTATEGIYLRTRSDGRLFNLNRLKAKTKVREALIRDLLFADDAGLAAHTEQGIQSLMDRFSRACQDFGLIISLKKTEVLGQNVEAPPAITIRDYELKAVNHFTYLGSTASNTLSLDKEIDKRIGKSATTLARLTTPGETWSTYAKQENRLNALHMRCMRRILGISWKDKVTNTEVLSRAGLPTMFTLLRQRRLRWLGHVRRMEDGRIPKDLLYGELISGKRRTGRPQLRFKDVCKMDLKALDIDTEHWEDLASDRSRWRGTLSRQLKSGEARLMHSAEENMHQTHYEQFGTFEGTVSVEGYQDRKIIIKGLRDHSYGKYRDWSLFHRYGLQMLHLEDGTFVNVGIVSMPATTSRLALGYVMNPDGSKSSVSSVDWDLSTCGEDGVQPKTFAFDFSAGGKKYHLECKVIRAPIFYIGFGWTAKIHEGLAEFTVNGVPGWGIAEWEYRNHGGLPEEFGSVTLE
ncbi:Hypp9298 [Branchiostoma lanceolatum]|uniref:Hypp9298 protein n=1 Tax=Branchiostoma lanceolatum TaxID=7740 RepID=A0A8J9ZFM9_BRALA|nr:Hypp9298 [Branchiostoma lanceolatum]